MFGELQSQVGLVELASERRLPQKHQYVTRVTERDRERPWEGLSDRIQTSHWRPQQLADLGMSREDSGK